MSHPDPHQTTNIPQHLPPLMTIKVSSTSSLFAGKKYTPHTMLNFCCWSMFCFNKHIQSRYISQSYLGEVFLGEVLPLSLKSNLFIFSEFSSTSKNSIQSKWVKWNVKVHKGAECNLEEFVRNTKQKRLSFTVWISSKDQAIYQQVNSSSCTLVAELRTWWLNLVLYVVPCIQLPFRNALTTYKNRLACLCTFIM